MGDVDLEGGTLTISRSISDAGGEVDVKDTKTHQARRLALDATTLDATTLDATTLDATTLDILRLHRERVEERAMLAGATLGPVSSLVFHPCEVGDAGESVEEVVEILVACYRRASPPTA